MTKLTNFEEICLECIGEISGNKRITIDSKFDGGIDVLSIIELVAYIEEKSDFQFKNSFMMDGESFYSVRQIIETLEKDLDNDQ